MMRHRLSGMVMVGALLMGVVPRAFATDGHFLHGVGAINSAMGGAGIAAPESLMGTFSLNPAGLMAFDGVRMEFSMEMFKADRTVTSSVPVPPPAPPGTILSGQTQSKKDFVPIPAFGASYKLPGERVVLGLAGLGIGGFGVDYRGSAFPTGPGQSANPIFLPQPNGFGQVYSNYQLLKISPSVAWAATDKLWLGAAFNVDWASLAVMPMPAASPDFDPATGTAFFPNATAADGAFGVGFQVGLLYHLNDLLALGASYSSEQWFSEFEWNSSHANPNLANFGEPRTFTFKLNVPAVLGGGVAVQAFPNLLLTSDFKYYFYENTPGFEVPSTGAFNPDGSVAGFGWEDIYSIAVGLKYEPTAALALYGGYNFSDNPVPDSLSMVNVAAPAIVQQHVSVGIGVRPNRHLEITAAYYHVFRNSGTGEILNPAIPPGSSSITNSMKEDSILLQFSYATRGGI